MTYHCSLCSKRIGDGPPVFQWEPFKLLCEACWAMLPTVPSEVATQTVGISGASAAMQAVGMPLRDQDLPDTTSLGFLVSTFSIERRFETILGPDIEARRHQQDAKWGGPAHDDSHDLLDLTQYMRKFLARAEDDLIGMGGRIQSQSAEDHLIDVIALGVATVQSARRKRAKAAQTP